MPCWRACFANPPTLSACLLCFVPATSACSSKWIFVTATHSTNKPKNGRQNVPLISLFDMMPMGPPDQKSKQSWEAYLSLYKHWRSLRLYNHPHGKLPLVTFNGEINFGHGRVYVYVYVWIRALCLKSGSTLDHWVGEDHGWKWLHSASE